MNINFGALSLIFIIVSLLFIGIFVLFYKWLKMINIDRLKKYGCPLGSLLLLLVKGE